MKKLLIVLACVLFSALFACLVVSGVILAVEKFGEAEPESDTFSGKITIGPVTCGDGQGVAHYRGGYQSGSA